MSAWSFEIKCGRLDGLTDRIMQIVASNRHRNAGFFLAEEGLLLNEPDETLVELIEKVATPRQVISRLAAACSWLFGSFELELGSHFRWNYLKLSFVNLDSASTGDLPSYTPSGGMTTNAPGLPEPAEQPDDLVVPQMIMTLRVYFEFLRGAVENSLRAADDQNSCDWDSMTFNKAT